MLNLKKKSMAIFSQTNRTENGFYLITLDIKVGNEKYLHRFMIGRRVDGGLTFYYPPVRVLHSFFL